MKLPDPGIPGFSFPEDEGTIHAWIADNDVAAMAAHAWGIWTALTRETGQIVKIEVGKKSYENPVRVFETWQRPQDIIQELKYGTNRFASFRQHGELDPVTKGEVTVVGFVKFNPEAAEHIVDYGLLDRKTLEEYNTTGYADVPAFSPYAISLKPVFTPLPNTDGKGQPLRYAPLPAWPGPPGGPPGPDTPFPPREWGATIWVDLQNASHGDGSVVLHRPNTSPSRSEAATTTSTISFTQPWTRRQLRSSMARPATRPSCLECT